MSHSRMSRWRDRLREKWAEMLASRQAGKERAARWKEERHLARMWASSNLVAEVRRHNDLMAEILLTLRTVLASTDRESGEGDNSEVYVDEVATEEEARQQEQDRQLDEMMHGRAGEVGEGESGIDRVEDAI
jgi:hypothetical protein